MIVSLKRCSRFDVLCVTYPLLLFTQNIIERQLGGMTNSVYIIFIYIGSLLGGLAQIIYDIYHLSLKKRLRPSLKNLGLVPFEIIKPKMDHQKKLLTFLGVFGLSLLNIGISYCNVLIALNLPDSGKRNFLFYIILLLAFDILFMKVILRFNVYLHHYVSIGLIVFGLITLHFYRVSFYQFHLTVPYYLLFAASISFIRAYLRLAMEQKFIQPLKISLYLGLFGLIFMGVFYLICFQYELSHESIKDVLLIPNSFRSLFNSRGKALFSLLYLLVVAVTQNGYYFIIYYTHPANISLLYYSNEIFMWIYFLTKEFGYSWAFALTLIGSICYLIGIFVYMEIVLIHLWGMSKKTKEEQAKMASSEFEVLSELV